MGGKQEEVPFSRSKNVVGLDIGSSAVKLVELADRRGGYSLRRVGVEPLSPEAIVDGSLADSAHVVEAIQRLVERTGVRNSQFATSISGHSVIVKRIRVPRMGGKELADSIQWEAEQYVPFDIHDVRLDYVVLSPSEVGHDTMDVLLVAAKRDKVDSYAQVIHAAGRKPVIVDVDVLALQNAYELARQNAYDLADLESSSVAAIVNIGASITNVSVLTGGSPIFWRDLFVGGRQFTEHLQREHGLAFDEAEALKHGHAVGGYQPGDAQPLLEAVAAAVAAEVQKTFELFLSTTSTRPVDAVFLAGGCALTPGLPQIFSQRLGLPVELLDPLRGVEYDRGEIHGDWLESIAPSLAIAVGLAMRRVGDWQA